MLSRSHWSASFGASPQLVGQVERTSTIEKPFLSIWFWKAFLIIFFACRMFFGQSTVTRAASATPSRVESISQTRIGLPCTLRFRP